MLPLKPKSVVSPTDNVPYIMAVLAMTVISVGGIVLVTALNPEQDNAGIIKDIITITVPTTAAILAFMKAQETHLSVNSRMDQWMKNAEDSSRAEGVVQGQEQANKRTDEISKKK